MSGETVFSERWIAEYTYKNKTEFFGDTKGSQKMESKKKILKACVCILASTENRIWVWHICKNTLSWDCWNVSSWGFFSFFLKRELWRKEYLAFSCIIWTHCGVWSCDGYSWVTSLGMVQCKLRSSSIFCKNGQATKDEEKNKSHTEEGKQVEITS